MGLADVARISIESADWQFVRYGWSKARANTIRSWMYLHVLLRIARVRLEPNRSARLLAWLNPYQHSFKMPYLHPANPTALLLPL